MSLNMYMKQRKRYSWIDINKKENFLVKKMKVTVEREFEDGEKRVDVVEKENPECALYVEVPVAYWRKANAIHRWFVEMCADGVDNCQPVYVDGSQIEELVNLCKEVLEDHSKASELLPTQDGSFFGSTEYDEWYFEDLEKTVKMLGNLDFKGDYVYEASW